MKRFVSCAILLLSTAGALAFAAAREEAKGYVYEDLNGNGRREPGEPGVPGVAVSNGTAVERTGRDGSYRLAVEDGTILFITKPGGFSVPVDEDNLPRFYYLHDPDGTPAELGLRYPGVDPTGPLPESVDFALRRGAPTDDYDVIWLADPQPRTDAEVGYLRDDVVAELIGTDAAFGVTLGDIMFDDLSLIPRYNRVIAQIGIPWYNVPGNHDINALSPDDEHSLETFKRYYGPTYYSFDHGRVHFVVLDDVHYLGKDAHRKGPSRRRTGGYEGRIDDEQLAWLENDLELVSPDKAIVLAMHIPLVSRASGEPPERPVASQSKLLGIIEDRRQVMAVAGHMHATAHHYLNAGDGSGGTKALHLHVLTAASGNWWSGPLDERGIPTTCQQDGTPNGYHVMSVRGKRLELRYKAAGKPDDYQMRISLGPTFRESERNGFRHSRTDRSRRDRIGPNQVRSTEVLVNLFDGGPRSTVEVRIGRRPAIPMARVSRRDPFAEDLFERRAKSGRFEIDSSTHLWAAGLPEDLGPGVHTIAVRAVDEYGREHLAHKVLEVAGE